MLVEEGRQPWAIEVGQTLDTPWREITEADVAAFSEVTGDAHRHNFETEFARETIFGDRVVNGMLVLSCAVGLLPVDSERIVAARRIHTAVLKRPVRIGQRIRVVGRVTRTLTHEDGLGLATLALKVLLPSGETAARARVDFLFTQPAAAGEAGS